MENEETVTVILKTSIPDGNGGMLHELTFREAEAGDACAMDLVVGDTNQALAMLSCMCGVALPVLKKLKMRDLKKITDEAGHLMGNEPTVPESGKTS